MEGELLRLGPIVLYSYGCALAAAFLAGTALAVREGVHRKYEIFLLLDLIIGTIGVGLLAGRFGYCLPDLWYYFTHPLDFLHVPQGGLSFIPALLAGVGYIYWFAGRHQQDFWSLLDVLAPGLATGLIIGFLGAVEVQPIEGAWYIGALYWPPPTLIYFTFDFLGLWYLVASRRRLAPGTRFCQIVTLDAAARIVSSGWAWALYSDPLPHAISVAAGLALFGVAILVNLKLLHRPQVRTALCEAAPTAEFPIIKSKQSFARPPRRKRLSVRHRLIMAVMWLGVYICFVLLLGHTEM